MRRPLVIAHRGASAVAPDNSAEAFEAAIAAGADMFEFDVRRTGDDRLIAVHDATVAGRPVVELSHDEVAALAGLRPPLLEEVLDIAQGRIALDVELKEDGYVERVVDAVRARFAQERVIFTSFLDSVVAQVRGLWPECRAGLLAATGSTGGDAPERLLERARACGATAVALEHALVERDGFGWAAGLEVYVWTVNDPADLRRLLEDDGVAGVITDVPDRAISLLPEQA